MKTSRTALFASLVLAFAGTAASVSCYAMGETSHAIETPPGSDMPRKFSPSKSAPPREISDCNHNGVDDLDEFFPPDCYGTLTTNGGK
ncbi:hypothetical protein [Polaromonas sp.]|uniref:hypothetical protein n=1 Tax=Polaromonas sp. TaxID=1869339 RepID=UPI0032665984